MAKVKRQTYTLNMYLEKMRDLDIPSIIDNGLVNAPCKKSLLETAVTAEVNSFLSTEP